MKILNNNINKICSQDIFESECRVAICFMYKVTDHQTHQTDNLQISVGVAKDELSYAQAQPNDAIKVVEANMDCIFQEQKY